MIHSDPKSFADAAEAAQLLIRNGGRRDVLSVTSAVQTQSRHWPIRRSLAGAIYAPNDESGDAYKFDRLGCACRKAGRAVPHWHHDQTQSNALVVRSPGRGGCRWRGDTADQ